MKPRNRFKQRKRHPWKDYLSGKEASAVGHLEKAKCAVEKALQAFRDLGLIRAKMEEIVPTFCGENEERVGKDSSLTITNEDKPAVRQLPSCSLEAHGRS